MGPDITKRHLRYRSLAVLVALAVIFPPFFAEAFHLTGNAYGVERTKPAALKKSKKCSEAGDAACMGWKEDKASIWTVKDEMDTYHYSLVINPKTDAAYGYFRQIALDKLFFGVLTAPPAPVDGKTPIRIAMEGNNPLVVIYQTWYSGSYRIGILDGRRYTEFALGTHEPVFEDLDGDGRYEVMAHQYITASSKNEFKEPILNYSTKVNGPLLAIYRYTPRFERVKGKGFEKYFIEHAGELIEKKYPLWIEKGKKPYMTDAVKRQLNYIVESWLATIESTQDPKIIKEALGKLKELPYPPGEEKKKVLERLIKNGYPMLRDGAEDGKEEK